MNYRKRFWNSDRGFSIIQLLVVCAVMGVVAATALPSTQRTLSEMRISGNARSLHNSVGLAKMRAASRFTRERVFVDLASNSYTLQYWDKTAADWVNEPSTVRLSSGVTFSTGGSTQAPPNTQAAIGQSAACTTNAGAAIAGTACITFNSRGIPMDGAGNPTGNSALYMSGSGTTYAVTVSATPLVRLWYTRMGTNNWVQR